MLKVTNYKVTHQPQCKASLTLPGFTHESYHFNGRPKLHGIMTLAAASRLYSLLWPYNKEGQTFMDWQEVTKNCFVFVTALKVNMSREVYDLSVPKHLLEANFFLGHVGNSSTASTIRFNLPGTKDILFEQISQIVTVDKNTQKPKALPDWFMEKYKGKGIMEQPLDVKPKAKPNNAYVHKFRVQWSDQDPYQFTSFLTYPRYAVDSVEAAMYDKRQKGSNHAIKDLTPEVTENGIKQAKICYLRQSALHDKLKIHVWQEKEADNRAYCSFLKDDGSEVCQVHLEYYK